MDNQYYVQGIAGNYLKNVICDPQTMKIHSSFLHGIENEQFKEGFLALLALVRNLYTDIVREPAAFGMLLKENVERDAKNADYTNSNASFVRVPNLLLVIGAKTALQPDMSLRLDGQELLTAAKELKITNIPFLLGKLREYGFEMNGFGKTVKSGDNIDISFPDSRCLTVALKAMAEALVTLNKGDLRKSKNYFYMLHYGLLENETVKAPKLTVDSIFHVLDDEKRNVASDLHGLVAASAKPAVKMGGFMRNDWSCVYTGIKSKKVLMSLNIVQDRLSAKLNLHHIGQYIGHVMDYPEVVRETLTSGGWECGHCNGGCSGGFAFELEGQAYNKCRCGAFVFEDLSAEITPYCKELLQLELDILNG